MVMKNEAGRYLQRALEQHKQYIDRAVIIDDGSTDNSIELCQQILTDIPLYIVKNEKSMFGNEVELRKLQWTETVSTNPDWILNLDADEIFEDKFAQAVKALLLVPDIYAYRFRLYDFWNDTHYREDGYWYAHHFYRPFLVKYDSDFVYQWNEQPQHCGRFPNNILALPSLNSELRLKHMGWASKKDRLEKFIRYRKLDPEALFGIKKQYTSILDVNPNLVEWIE